MPRIHLEKFWFQFVTETLLIWALWCLFDTQGKNVLNRTEAVISDHTSGGNWGLELSLQEYHFCVVKSNIFWLCGEPNSPYRVFKMATETEQWPSNQIFPEEWKRLTSTNSGDKLTSPLHRTVAWLRFWRCFFFMLPAIPFAATTGRKRAMNLMRLIIMTTNK